VAAGADSLPRVAVASYVDLPIPEPPAITLSEKSLSWFSQYWQTVALFGLVGAALFSLRSFAKTAPASNDSEFERGFDLPLDDAIDIDLSSLTDEESESFSAQAPADDSPPRLRTTGGDIKNDLTAMVRENPDAAATLLRNWITEASS
jgi:flagellar M-ring protein FliF